MLRFTLSNNDEWISLILFNTRILVSRLNQDVVIRDQLELQMERSDNMPLLNCPLVQEYLNSERIKDPEPFNKNKCKDKSYRDKVMSDFGG